MTDTTVNEERLFFLLNSIEELKAQTEQQQEIITALLEQSAQNGEDLSDVITKLSQTATKTYKDMLKDLQLIGNQLPNYVATEVSKTVKDEINKASADVMKEKLGETLENHDEKIASSSDALIEKINTASNTADILTQDIQKNFSYKMILVWFGTVFLFIVLLFAFIFFFVPSKSEIAERRAELSDIKSKVLNIDNCDGQTCVRVYKDACNFGKNGDYCKVNNNLF